MLFPFQPIYIIDTFGIINNYIPCMFNLFYVISTGNPVIIYHTIIE